MKKFLFLIGLILTIGVLFSFSVKEVLAVKIPVDSHYDVGGGWSNETNAYDDNTGTYSRGLPDYWLELFPESSFYCDQIKLVAVGYYDGGEVDPYTYVDVYDTSWRNVYEGRLSSGWWRTLNVDRNISKARIKVERSYDKIHLHEFEFYGEYPVTPPTVTNDGGASNVTANSARLNGEVTDTGGDNPNTYFYWGDNDGGTTISSWDYQAVVPDSPSQPQGVETFYKDISGLSAGTTYYYRCYASNSAGSVWAGNTATFTPTPPSPPTVTNNGGASNVTINSARLNGEVTDTGGDNPNTYFYWGDNDGGTTISSWDYQAVVPDSPSQPQGVETFYKDISGLNPGITYYYRCYATNSEGSDWADSTESFITEAITEGPVWQSCETGTLTTGINWDYTMGYQFTPTLDGQVTKLCGYFSGTKWVRLYNSSYSVLASTQITSSNNWACTSIDPVSVTANSVYYVVAEMAGSGASTRSNAGLSKTCNTVTIDTSVYQSPSGTFNGSHGETKVNMYGMPDIVFFPTVVTVPTVSTEIADVNLQNNQATLKGSITDTGGADVTEIGFEWGINTVSYTDSWTGSYTGDFSHTIPESGELTPGTIYYYKAKAYNSAGWSALANTNEKRVVIYTDDGGQQSFTTESVCKDVCESCSADGDCCSGLHCQSGVCCEIDKTCCSSDSHCPTDSCVNSSLHIDNYCNTGVCYCESSTTTCSAGGCCEIGCDNTTGCYTTAGVCPDSCETNTLVVGETCSGCGANGATGTCGGGTPYTCNSTTHSECQSIICGGTTYYCTQDGETWQWRTSPNPDRCGGNLDDCYSYDSGCEIRDYLCLAGSCTYSYDRYTDTSCSYTDCSAEKCTKTGTYDDYYCDGGSCTAHPDSCSENCDTNTACSGGVCYFDTGDGNLCNTEWRVSPGEGDGNYGIGGDYLCQGTCDGFGNCDYAVNCTPCDTTSPTTQIKVIRTSTGEDVTTAGYWLKADNYTIQFEDEDQAEGSGLNCETCSCEYSVYACDVGGTNCTTPIESLISRNPNWSFQITAGTSPYNLEGLGRYLIYSGTTDNANNSGTDYKYLNFDFTLPETWIE